jgi:hypothetical protein
MLLMELKSVRKTVLILSVALLWAAVPVIARFVGLTPLSILFMSVSFLFMAVHWWLLAAFIDSLSGSSSFLILFRGMMSLFPAALALSSVFIAGRIDRALVLPAGIGIAVIPSAATVFALFSGLSGFLPSHRMKGCAHD